MAARRPTLLAWLLVLALVAVGIGGLQQGYRSFHHQRTLESRGVRTGARVMSVHHAYRAGTTLDVFWLDEHLDSHRATIDQPRSFRRGDAEVKIVYDPRHPSDLRPAGQLHDRTYLVWFAIGTGLLGLGTWLGMRLANRSNDA